jgi:hypothetical protein
MEDGRKVLDVHLFHDGTRIDAFLPRRKKWVQRLSVIIGLREEEEVAA